MRTRTADFIRFGERLAGAPDPPVNPTAVANSLSIPLSTAHEWARQLRFHRALLPTPRGLRVDRAQLLAVYTAHRITRQRPVLETATSLGPEEVSRALADARLPHALCMLSAANFWTFYEPRRSIEVYLPRRMTSRLSDVIPAGENQLHFFDENPTDLPLREVRGVHLTSPFLTLLDCRAHPEGGAHAHFLASQMMGWREG